MAPSIGSEEYRLIGEIEATIQSANAPLSQLFAIQEGYSSFQDAYAPDEKFDRQSELLKQYVKQARLKFLLLCERISAPKLLAEFEAASAELGSNYDSNEIDDEGGGAFSPHLKLIRTYLWAINGMLDPTHLTALGVFRDILCNTGKIVYDVGIPPASEAQVRESVWKVLKYAFPQAEREIAVPLGLKNYKMDMGVRKLRAAAEFKFIVSDASAKTAMEGIYADMHGYGGTHDWQYYFAVFYQTGNFLTQSAAEHEFKWAQAHTEWQPIVITAPGVAKKKTTE